MTDQTTPDIDVTDDLDAVEREMNGETPETPAKVEEPAPEAEEAEEAEATGDETDG